MSNFDFFITTSASKCKFVDNYFIQINVTNQVAWSDGLSVSWSVTVVSPAKMAEPIEMPFGMLSWVNPRNHVLDGGADAPTVRGTFRGVSSSLQNT